MIQPIIAAQAAPPVAAIQHNTDVQGVLQSQIAQTKVQENERQIRETVTNKDEAVFYEQNHDAKEEGRNKYENLYTNKKKKGPQPEKSRSSDVNRVNFDLKI